MPPIPLPANSGVLRFKIAEVCLCAGSADGLEAVEADGIVRIVAVQPICEFHLVDWKTCVGHFGKLTQVEFFGILQRE